MSKFISATTSGILAGAAGTTALNAYGYLKQGLAGTPSSNSPQQSAKAVAEAAGIEIPGRGDELENRVEGFGPLTGYAVGLGVGAIAGGIRGLGVKIPIWLAPAVVGLGAMAISDGAMTALKLTNPKTWTTLSVLQDAAPHLIYGAVTTLALHRMVDPHTVQVA